MTILLAVLAQLDEEGSGLSPLQSWAIVGFLVLIGFIGWAIGTGFSEQKKEEAERERQREQWKKAEERRQLLVEQGRCLECRQPLDRPNWDCDRFDDHNLDADDDDLDDDDDD